jgi:type IV pilus biogenesis protein CpaD/CtpE
MILIGALALSACEASTPSHVSVGKIQVQEQMVAKTLDARHIDPARVDTIAEHFMRTGKGDMVLNVSYFSKDPAGRKQAQKEGEAYKKAFGQRGVTNFSVVTVPIADPRYASKAVLTYSALAASPPSGCNELPGYQGAENMETIDEYRFGCDTRAALSRMIADPSDLMGKAGTQNNDSRRSGPIIEPYKAGTPNQQMKGYQASGIGG